MLPPATNSSLYPSPTPDIWPKTSPLAPLSPFPATLTGAPQLFENPATLSPVFATLTGHVRHKSFACHSCKKHRGVCTVTYKTFPLSTSIHPPEIVNREPEVTHRGSRSTSRQSRITSYHSLNPLESALPQNAPITLLESALTKTQHSKSFRMNTSEKAGDGVTFIKPKSSPKFFRPPARFVSSHRSRIAVSRTANPGCPFLGSTKTGSPRASQWDSQFWLSSSTSTPNGTRITERQSLLTTHYSLLTSCPSKTNSAPQAAYPRWLPIPEIAAAAARAP